MDLPRTVARDRSGKPDLTVSGTSKPATPVDIAVAEMNRQYAVILGGSGGILRETIREDGERGFDVISPAQLKLNELPKQVLSGGKLRPIVDVWMRHPARREIEGFCFRPNLATPDGYHNLWAGFAVEPQPAASCQRLLDHIYENVCNGNDSHFAWFIGFFAQIIQEPHVKPGTAIALTGPQGAGKTITGRSVGRLLGRHYLLVAAQRYVTGRFNSHLAALLLMQVEEGFWGGDHSVDGTLKDLITGDTHQVEYKGREPYSIDNHLRLLITSNQARAIPAAFDQRRFAVFEVSGACANNHRYFRAIDTELRNGGYGALLHHLQTYDISDINLRQPPKTDALLRQKTQSADPQEAWWLDALYEGTLPAAIAERPGVASCRNMYTKYLEDMQQRRVSRTVASETLGKFLRKVVPGLAREKETFQRHAGSPTVREWCYRFPSLGQCRVAFDEYATQTYDWPVERNVRGEIGDAEWES